MSIFHTYDIRGIYKKEITIETAQQIAEAVATMFKKGTVVISYDGRHGAEELANAVREVFEKKGDVFTIHFTGLATTPMFSYLINSLKAVGGIMVTASHNPPEYTGFKVYGRNAVTISGTEVEKYIQK
ncbi:MAG: hypothetical protein WC757_02890 [Candidatus Paceibacterota bacterium]|jgi:phosphomannomutase